MPPVSVLMPVHNGESFLHESIESILSQSFTNFEFIIINDASDDNTEQIILSYSDERIRYYKNQTRQGIANTLNSGLKLCKGELIARMDADDISEKDRLLTQVNFMKKHTSVSLAGSYISLFGDNINRIKKYPLTTKQINWAIFTTNPVAHSSVIFRASLYNAGNFFYQKEFSPSEDYELWSRLALICNIANIPEMLVRYRLHASQTSIVQQQEQILRKKEIQKNYIIQLFKISKDTKINELHLFLNQPSYFKMLRLLTFMPSFLFIVLINKNLSVSSALQYSGKIFYSWFRKRISLKFL